MEVPFTPSRQAGKQDIMPDNFRMACRVALAAWMTFVGCVILARAPRTIAAATSTWYWQNPLPRGYSMSAVACRSAMACVAVGQHGSVATTDDGGQHWTDRVSGTSTDLWSVACPSQAVCYAAGFLWGPPSQNVHAVFLKSLDGGTSWQQPSSHLPIGPGQFLSSLACSSVTTCLAAGGAVSPSTSILRTTDGGMTWRTIHMPISQGLGAVTCATTAICFGMNGISRAVVRSVDGGGTWQRRAPVPNAPLEVLEAMACPEANTCVVTSSYCCEEGSWGDIFLTTDGAKTWKHVGHLARNPLYGVVCPRATTCYASTSLSVVRTSDGGRTWSSRRLVDPASGIACPMPTTCYAVAGFAVLKTGDGFDHTEETLSHSAIHYRFLNDISCPSTTSCYATGAGQYARDEGGLAATTDGGRTWREKPKPPHQLTRLSCPSPSICYAINSDQASFGPVYRSGDGAETWQRLNRAANTVGARDISCVSTTTCYATSAINGQGGNILAVLVTHNGGRTWRVKTGIDAAARAEPTSQLGRVTCPSVKTCFVTVTNGFVGAVAFLSTTNGGATWTRAHVWVFKDSGDLPLLACPTVTTCYVVPYSGLGASVPSPGTVLVTHDAGARWHRTVVSKGAAFAGIACATAQACRLVGSAGIFATGDGGMTWQRQVLADGEQPPQLASIACPAIDTCYAVGEVMIVGTHSPGQLRS